MGKIWNYRDSFEKYGAPREGQRKKKSRIPWNSKEKHHSHIERSPSHQWRQTVSSEWRMLWARNLRRRPINGQKLRRLQRLWIIHPDFQMRNQFRTQVCEPWTAFRRQQ